ncbi:N-acetyl sugar amidotransferase [Shewanella algae]|uniref:N-acetyl sugar amidotransferase n=1 Tax=Shewanella algae TaxID=38313 RepID=UPI001AAFA216|nr:N-acetyl sugar amidotransferase [Shewanella algae]MBO2581708.1 N-acetyl sugar amidotransferase [Shewanella algae]
MNEIIVCKSCVMDSSAVEFVSNPDGTCNFCSAYRMDESKATYSKADLDVILDLIKKHGKGKKYDCIIGVSGGVDSTYVAYLVKKYGLRPLAVHLDNGWNSELAVDNVKKTLDKLDIPLFTHVLNWKEFKELQIAFLRASIPGMEIPTDHAITSLLYRTAVNNNIKFIINGSNYRMEKIMPRSWSEFRGQMDFYLIKSVYKKFTGNKLKQFPGFSLFEMFKWKGIDKIKVVNILDYIDFDKDVAMECIQNELGWVYYGGKHYESIYTRFTQAYIQPKKFNIDKRKAHYSNLICAGMMERSEAIERLAGNPYPDQEMEKRDLLYFKKKLGFSDDEFEAMMCEKPKTYMDYPCVDNTPLLLKLEQFALKLNDFIKGR